MTQLTLDLSPDGTKQGRVTLALLAARPDCRLTILKLNEHPELYGTSASRFLRWSVHRLREQGIPVHENTVRRGKVMWKEWWTTDGDVFGFRQT